jgi:hypothetical protein
MSKLKYQVRQSVPAYCERSRYQTRDLPHSEPRFKCRDIKHNAKLVKREGAAEFENDTGK